MPLILIIEDDETISLSLKVFFEQKGYEVACSDRGDAGLEKACRDIPDAVILDMKLPDIHGLEILRKMKETHPEISVIVMTGHGEISEAVQAMKLGAEFFFQKPVDLEELLVIVEKGVNLNKMRQECALYRETAFPFIGRSRQTQGIIHMISLLASNPLTTVLVQGETGTGKELIARNIHALSMKKNKPFLDINCASIPEHLVESELFGYEAGAFTDAKKTKKGLIELAHEGTLFLDEIGDMPKNVQAKLLRVLESRTIRRVGGTRDISVDVRIIAATNRDLGQLVQEGVFRDDLYYRLNVMPLVIPPLRERPEDVDLIAEYLLDELRTTLGKKNILGFSQEAVGRIHSYRWPGNVRELRNVIERAVILCSGQYISVSHLALSQEQADPSGDMTLSSIEKGHIQNILRLTDGNRTKAAQMLGIARSTLNEKLKTYGLH